MNIANVNSDRLTKIISVVLSVIFGVLLVSMVANAVTTVSGTTITLENSETITNGTNGTITLTADVMKLVGTASTSAIKVGDELAIPTINGMIFGYCTTTASSSFAATTTGPVDCTVESALTGALLTSDRVFVQATSSWDTPFVILAASTTGVSTIQLEVLNSSVGTVDTALGATSINFWSLR